MQETHQPQVPVAGALVGVLLLLVAAVIILLITIVYKKGIQGAKLHADPIIIIQIVPH